METKNTNPQSLLEAVRYFSDLDVCHRYMMAIKWPDGKMTCPKCGGENIGVISSRRMLQCKAKGCRKQFSVKVGTIFEDSPLGLDKWFVAVWCVTNAKNGISSCELARALDITQKSAWFMLHRVRLAMQTGTFTRKLGGEVEVDETFIGGAARFRHKKDKNGMRGPSGKAVVMGLLERDGELRAHVVEGTKARTLNPVVRENVTAGSAVYTDAHQSYVKLAADFEHQMVDHAVEYVRGRVHTNGLENFWSLLKRSLKGTYVSVEPFHLYRYVDEQAFRFNRRKVTDADRFNKVMEQVVGKRLTYKSLIGGVAKEVPPSSGNSGGSDVERDDAMGTMLA